MLTCEGQEFLGMQAIMEKIAVQTAFAECSWSRVWEPPSATTSRRWTSSPPPTTAF